MVAISCKESPSNDSGLVTDKSESERKNAELPRFPSPAATIEQTVGVSTVRIDYSRPSVISSEGNDRTDRIWGLLVPYDFDSRPSSSRGKPIPWRAGANENTIITFSDDVQIEGKALPAGTYGLFMAIHEAGGATVIFSNKSDSWGSFSYDEAEDALRVEVETSTIQPTERLTYTIQDVDGTSAKVLLDWEKKRIAFTVSFDTNGKVMSDLREYLSDTTGLTWSDYNRAAAYSADNEVNLEEGLRWAEISVAKEENYRNLSTKAKVLVALGNLEEALSVQNKALGLSSTTANNYYSYGTELLKQGETGKAMKIYGQLQTKWPDHWLTAHGLARGNSALGNYKEAIAFERDALTKAPDANKGFIEWAITKLEQGIDFN